MLGKGEGGGIKSGLSLLKTVKYTGEYVVWNDRSFKMLQHFTLVTSTADV